ncbi:MAG: hypothetical protein IKQ41_04675 [Clostridia bacterium]|nr:hypothetical protein [Clostridia bacterium]
MMRRTNAALIGSLAALLLFFLLPVAAQAETDPPKKTDVKLYIEELGNVRGIPSVKRYQSITLVSNAFSLTDEQAKSYNAQGITFEIIGVNSKITREAKLVKYGKQYRLECALSDTGKYYADRYTVKVKAPKVMWDQFSFSSFAFDLSDPDISFEVEGAREGRNGEPYWTVEEAARLTVRYETDGKNTDTFEYAVYPAGGTPAWQQAQKPVYAADGADPSPQTCSFSIQVPQDAWNNVYTVAVRHNGQEAAEQTGTFLQPLRITADCGPGGGNKIYAGVRKLNVHVNRTSGKLWISINDIRMSADFDAEGNASIDLNAWGLSEKDSVQYVNNDTDEGAFLQVERAEAITLSPLGGVYLDEETPESMRFDLNAQEGLQTQAWLEDGDGNVIGEKAENLAQITFATDDLSRAARIVCDYPQLRGYQIKIPVKTLPEAAGQTDGLILITEKPAFDQEALPAEGGTLTGRSAVPNGTVDLYLDKTLFASTWANGEGAFAIQLFDQVLPGREMTVRCTDILGQTRVSAPVRSASLEEPDESPRRQGEAFDCVLRLLENPEKAVAASMRVVYDHAAFALIPSEAAANENSVLLMNIGGIPEGKTVTVPFRVLPDAPEGVYTISFEILSAMNGQEKPAGGMVFSTVTVEVLPAEEITFEAVFEVTANPGKAMAATMRLVYDHAVFALIPSEVAQNDTSFLLENTGIKEGTKITVPFRVLPGAPKGSYVIEMVLVEAGDFDENPVTDMQFSSYHIDLP